MNSNATKRTESNPNQKKVPQNASAAATEEAKKGNPLPADKNTPRSPKQENL